MPHTDTTSNIKKTVSVIIPVYNPPAQWEGNIIEHIIALVELFPQYTFHFHVVNDGTINLKVENLTSTVQKYVSKYSIISSPINKGKGNALKKGVLNAYTDYYICSDWDFPFGIQIIGEYISALENGNDIVIINRGIQYPNSLPFIRSLVTRGWRFCVTHVFKLNVTNTQGGLKGFNRKGREYFLRGTLDGFAHDFEFVYLSRKHNLRLTEVSGNIRPGLSFTNFSLGQYFRELKDVISFIRRHASSII